MKRVILLIAIVPCAILTPFSCLLIVNSVNPMKSAFLTEFTLANESGQPVRVTPVGTIGPHGKKCLLPTFSNPWPAVPHFIHRTFEIGPGESVDILYDWDDINFSEIAVQNSEGSYRQLIVDPAPTENQYHPPETDLFVIPHFGSLPTITPEVLAVVNSGSRIATVGIFPFAVVLAPIGLIILTFIYRKNFKGQKIV